MTVDTIAEIKHSTRQRPAETVAAVIAYTKHLSDAISRLLDIMPSGDGSLPQR